MSPILAAGILIGAGDLEGALDSESSRFSLWRSHLESSKTGSTGQSGPLPVPAAPSSPEACFRSTR